MKSFLSTVAVFGVALLASFGATSAYASIIVPPSSEQSVKCSCLGLRFFPDPMSNVQVWRTAANQYEANSQCGSWCRANNDFLNNEPGVMGATLLTCDAKWKPGTDSYLCSSIHMVSQNITVTIPPLSNPEDTCRLIPQNSNTSTDWINCSVATL